MRHIKQPAIDLPVSTPEERINKALQIIGRHGGDDSAHHKAWALDQAVRALTGCPLELVKAKDCNGTEYTYSKQGESDEYKKFVAEVCDGEDGPNTYEWDVGRP